MSRFLWAPVIAYMALIFFISSIQSPPPLPGGWDKSLHGALYVGLAALLVRALSGGWRRRVTFLVALASVVISTLYGVSDEYHQSFVPTRQSEVMDVVADGAGAFVAAAALYLWDIIRGRHGL